MFIAIFNTVAPILACALVGYVWARRGLPFESVFLTRLVTNVGFPCLIFHTLIKVEVSGEVLFLMGLAAFLTTTLFAVIAASILKAANLDIRTYLPSMTFANTGNMGLSLCLLAFGPQGLALGIGYFTANAVMVFVFGPAIASGNPSITSALKVPVFWATIAAVGVMYTDAEMPFWIMRSLELLGGFAIPLMLITLGVSLADLEVDSLGRSIGLSVLRLGMGFAVGWGAAELMGFEGVARGVVIIECAMPAAVFNYMFAQMYETRPTEVAGVVMVSTLMSFLTMPLLLWFVMNP